MASGYGGHADSLNPSRLTRHLSSASQDTSASGIADSTISYGSLHLSRFPHPPSSIPSTPTHSGSPTSSAPGPFTTIPTKSHPPAIPSTSATAYGFDVPHSATASSASAISRNGRDRNTNASPPGSLYGPSRTLSPYDWHEGASSIDVDATEDRLLPTSFITSLLQEGTTHRKDQRSSFSSDAVSGISEMTYPPLLSYAEATRRDNAMSSRVANSRTTPPFRVSGARPPPSSFSPIPEDINRNSSDSDTLYSNHDRQPLTVRTASMLRGGIPVGGAHIVGVAPASYTSSGNNRLSTHQEYAHESNDEHDSAIDHYKELHRSALYSLEPQRPFQGDRSQPLQPVRNSVYSSKSSTPSLLSKISSNKSFRRAFSWRRKPLPPVPTIPNIPIATEMAHRMHDETAPLPDLVNRAGTLHGLLEKGRHPHHSMNSYYRDDVQLSGYGDADPISAAKANASEAMYHNSQSQSVPKDSTPRHSRKCWTVRGGFSSTRSKRNCFLMTGCLVIILAAVGAAVGVTVKHKKHDATNCSGNFAGALCNLNATCICTSPVSGQCNPLAQNIVQLVPSLNSIFNGNMSVSSVYNSIWSTEGSPSGNNCASQSVLVDVGTTLNANSYPNRTLWAQTALLWNFVQTQDRNASEKLQTFVVSAPWLQLEGSDGRVPDKSSSFSISVSGYTYDFAAQTVAPNYATFVNNGQPSSAQLSQVNSDIETVLDRMYTFAVASSTQRDNALSIYWKTVLKQNPSDLVPFTAALSNSPLLLPFDASSSPVAQIYSNSTSVPFPPPLACYPSLSNSQIQRITAIESGVFGLGSFPNSTMFDTACFSNHPIYGILDVLRLRLPFPDSRSGVARQAAVLNKDVASRTVLYSGEILSTFPGTSALSVTTLSPSQLDPRQYGTIAYSNHVILQYLSSIADINVALALVKFILASGKSQVAVPPAPPSILLQSLQSIPVLEVAVFGTIRAPDVDSAYSAFNTSSGDLFFGSFDGTLLRNWAIEAANGSVVWAESATSPLVVRDNSFSDETVNNTWGNASIAITNNISGVGVSNITSAFQATGKFVP